MWDGGPPARDQPAPGPSGAPGGQASPRLTLGPILLPPEQSSAPAVFLKALPIPLYHMVPPRALHSRAALVPSSLDGASLPLILSPLPQPEGSGSAPVGKPPAQMLTLNLVGALPLLSPGLGAPLGSPSKVRSAGRYLCPHCGRDCLKPSVLEKHIRSHTGERPFPCSTCGIAFKTQSNLYKHRRTQTHLSNSRRCSGPDGGGGPPDEGAGAGGGPRVDGSGDGCSQTEGTGAAERPPSRGPCLLSAAQLALVAESLDTQPEAAPCAGSTFADGEGPLDSIGLQPPWKLPEQKSPAASKLCPLQRQQATSWEKAWDAKGSEGRLRKCESSDSGYLSRSDSAEQPLVPASPLHSQPEPSAEGGPELEKKRLEEHIAQLISHNQAVVDDPQLDTVRPRKTVLSKQGSIDLPMPYTYKDSFHFDMRALEPGRRRPATVGSARSTCTPPDKARPLSFHSVPTQFSTTVDCVPVTRSNSLPFVESSRTWREWGPDPQEACPRRQRPLSPRLAPAHLGCSLGPVLSAVPSSHPRALVRQAAVEDLPSTPVGERPVPTEDPQKTTAGEGAASRGRVSGKRGGQRKLKMFSQEKWQVYGDETFKRIYQKGKASPHGGKKVGEVRVDPLPQAEAMQTGAMKTPVCVDTRTPVSGNATSPVCRDMRTPISGDTNTPICGDATSLICRDVRTPTCGDMSIPINGDVRTPVCGDVRTPISGEVRIPVSGDVRTPICGDERTPVCGDVRTPVCGDVRAPVSGEVRTPVCGNVRTSVCGDVRTPVCGDVRTPVSGDVRTPVCGDVRTPVSGEARTPVCEDVLPPAGMSSGSLPGSWGGPMAPEFSLLAEPPKSRSGSSDEPGLNEVMAPPTLSCRDPPCLGHRSPPHPPNRRLEPGGKLSPGGDPGDPKQERVGCSDVGEETHAWAQSTLGLPSSGPSHGLAMGDRLPSERKKVKVEGLGGQGRSEAVGVGSERGGSPEVPVQAASLLAWAWDSEPLEKPTGLLLSADCKRGGKDLHRASVGASSASSLTVLRQAGPRAKKPPMHPAAMSPRYYPQVPDGSSSQLVALPWALDNAFTPKYLLRLPQGDSSSELPVPRRSEQGQDSLCRRWWPEERVPFVRSGRGMPLSPGPASGRTPGEADSINKDPDWSRARDGVEGTQVGEERGDKWDTSTLGPRGPASIPPPTTSGPCLAWAMEREVTTVRPLCSGSTMVTGRPPGGTPNPGPPVWEKAPEDPPSGPFLSAITQPPAWPEPTLPPHSGNPRSCGTKGPFPSLGSELRLTWCCLSRSLPLPSEQKGTASSVYSSLHLPGAGPREEGPEEWPVTSRGDLRPVQMSKLSCPVAPGMTSQDWVSKHEQKKRLRRRRAKMSHGSSRQRKLRTHPTRYKRPCLQSQAQLRARRLLRSHWVLRGGCHCHPREGRDPCQPLSRAASETAAGGHSFVSSESLDNDDTCISLPSRAGHAPYGEMGSRGSSHVGRHISEVAVWPQQPSPSQGNLNKCDQENESAEKKPHKIFSKHTSVHKDASPLLGLNPRGEPSGATSEPSLCQESVEKHEEACGRIPVTIPPSAGPRSIREQDDVAVKDISPPAGEHGNYFPRNTAAASGLSLHCDSWPAVGEHHLLPGAKGLDGGLPETEQLLPPEHVSVDPKLGVLTDAQKPSSSDSKGTFPHHDDATSVATLCTSLGARAGHTALGTPSAGSQGHSGATEIWAPSSPDRKAMAEGTSPSPLLEKPSSGQKLSDAVPLGPTEKPHLETSASGLSSKNSHQEEGAHKAVFPSRGQYECGEMVTPHCPVGNGSEKCQVAESIAQKDCVAPSSPGQHTDTPETPSRTVKKRSLEGVRKQTRVEFSDTSSDDEDRLVIEI